MLGRHVYRVHSAEGNWSVTKDGEDQPRRAFGKREAALAEAYRLAEADQPSRVTVDDGDGIIVEERLFGADLSQELEFACLTTTGMPIDSRIRIERGDITRLAVDAIVNAANSSLLGGGGVDGAIHRAAGPELLAECRTIGGCPPGEARLTRGYRLPTGHVIHTVGPVWRGGGVGERTVLADCYSACLAIASERRFRDVAFPAIATGVYGFPREEAARIAVAAARRHLAGREMPARLIFVCFDDATAEAYRAALGDAP